MTLRAIVLRLLLMVLGLLVGALTLELGLRCKVAYDQYRVSKASNETPHGAVTAGQMVKFDDNIRLGYSFRPHLDVEFVKVRVQTNQEGFRDSDHPLARPAGIYHRVVTLGDSYMFGWGVDYTQGFVRVAADQLPGWEFINLALPGYNAVQEVECFKIYGLKYKPDIVIIDYIGNDTQLPYYIQRTPDDFSASFLMDWISGQLSRNGLQEAATIYTDAEKKNFKYEDDPARVPVKYRDMVGWGAVERAYKELAQLGLKHQFKVVLYCFPHRDDRVIAIAKANGFEICDFTDKLDEATRARKASHYMDSDLCLPRPDTHPSPILHKLGGDFLADWLKREFSTSK